MTTLTNTPLAIQAGDTLAWLITNADYSASDGWQLHYTLINATNKIQIDGTASGANHAINVIAANTASYVAGDYAWQSYVTKGAERYTVATGNIKVKPNIASLTNFDSRTHVKKTLDAIESYLENRNVAVQDYEISGRRLRYIPIPDLIKLRDTYRIEYNSEQAANNPSLRGKNKLQVRLR